MDYSYITPYLGVGGGFHPPPSLGFSFYKGKKITFGPLYLLFLWHKHCNLINYVYTMHTVSSTLDKLYLRALSTRLADPVRDWPDPDLGFFFYWVESWFFFFSMGRIRIQFVFWRVESEFYNRLVPVISSIQIFWRIGSGFRIFFHIGSGSRTLL